MLTLDDPPETVTEATVMTFTGSLLRGDTEHGVDGLTVEVMDSDVESDDLLASGTTDSKGRFAIRWLARPTDPLDTTVEVYARFQGTEDYEPSRSPPSGHHNLKIVRDPRRGPSPSRSEEWRQRQPPAIR